MQHLTTLDLVNFEETLDELEINPKDHELGHVMLASCVVGPNSNRIAAELHIRATRVRQYGQLLRKHGIWEGHRVVCGWFEPDGGLAFLCDILTVKGLLTRHTERMK